MNTTKTDAPTSICDWCDGRGWNPNNEMAKKIKCENCEGSGWLNCKPPSPDDEDVK